MRKSEILEKLLDIQKMHAAIDEAQEHMNGTMTPEKQRAYDIAQEKYTVSTMRAKPGWHLIETKKEPNEEEKRRRRLMYGS